jgi:hypothetical protein
MIDLCELLHSRGLPQGDRLTKLVRHQSSQWDIERLLALDQLELYQSNQARPVFDNCKYLVSFVGEKHSLARLVGVYRINGVSRDATRSWPSGYHHADMPPGPLWYDITKLSGFADLEKRIVIKWGSSARAWVQWLNSREIIEILPPGYVREFPGFDEVLLTYPELCQLMEHPASNREWHRALSSAAGIYLITDTRNGLQYVGSASGASGLLARWHDYARTGHGGNKLLRTLISDDPAAALHFQFSIMRIMVPTTPRDEVLEAEKWMKRKLGSRAHGLNT